MTDSINESKENNPPVPKAIVKKMRWPFPLVWIVPILAAAAAMYYYVDHEKDRGPDITISFDNVSGFKAGETNIARHGVPVGKVMGIELSKDGRSAIVHARLQKSADSFAKKGAMFWIVSPQISADSISGLGTLLSGPYIEAVPGTGETAKDFQGLGKPPQALGDGLRVILHAPRLEHLQTGAPVYFRGIDVGLIQDVQLSGDGTGIDVHIFVRPRFRQLVTLTSKFWYVKGVDLKGGLFSGVQMKVDSLKSLVSGEVAFAASEDRGEQALDGAEFPLFDEPRKEWEEWSPKWIKLPPEESKLAPDQTDLPTAPDAVRSVVK